MMEAFAAALERSDDAAAESVAFNLAEASDLAAIADYEAVADQILVDAKAPKGASSSMATPVTVISLEIGIS